jgi:hypothetical protein
MFRINEQQRWLIIAGLAGIAATRIAGEAVSTSWRIGAGEEPPEDPTARDLNWTSAILFTAAAGAVVGVAELLARRGAGAAWKEVTGKRPPRPRKKAKRRSR